MHIKINTVYIGIFIDDVTYQNSPSSLNSSSIACFSWSETYFHSGELKYIITTIRTAPHVTEMTLCN